MAFFLHLVIIVVIILCIFDFIPVRKWGHIYIARGLGLTSRIKIHIIKFYNDLF